MAQTTYRQPQPTLEELLAGASSGAPPASAPPQASGSDTTDNRLLALLTQPESQGPAPEVNQLSTWDKIRMTIGDSLGAAFQAYGATLAGGQAGPFHGSYEKFTARQDQQKQQLADWQRKTADAQREAKMRGAQYLMSKQDREQMKADEQKGRMELKQLTLDSQEADRKQRALEFQQKQQADQQQFEQKKSWDLQMEKARQSHDETVARIRERAAGGDVQAKDDKKGLGEIIRTIGGMSRIAKVALAGGDPANKIPATTPDEIENQISQEIDALQLSPDARKAAEAYAMKELGPIVRDFQIEQQNKQMAQNGPQQSQAGPAINPILGALGNAPTPQKY